METFLLTLSKTNFAKAGLKHDRKRLVVMENDPSQSSKAAMNTLRDIEGELLKIPSRSPDLNPVEYVFNTIKNSLCEDALKRRTEAESFLQFQERVVCALKCITWNVIDKTIESFAETCRRYNEICSSQKKY